MGQDKASMYNDDNNKNDSSDSELKVRSASVEEKLEAEVVKTMTLPKDNNDDDDNDNCAVPGVTGPVLDDDNDDSSSSAAIAASTESATTAISGANPDLPMLDVNDDDDDENEDYTAQLIKLRRSKAFHKKNERSNIRISAIRRNGGIHAAYRPSGPPYPPLEEAHRATWGIRKPGKADRSVSVPPTASSSSSSPSSLEATSAVSTDTVEGSLPAQVASGPLVDSVAPKTNAQLVGQRILQYHEFLKKQQEQRIKSSQDTGRDNQDLH